MYYVVCFNWLYLYIGIFVLVVKLLISFIIKEYAISLTNKRLAAVKWDCNSKTKEDFFISHLYLNHGPLEPEASVLQMSYTDPLNKIMYF